MHALRVTTSPAPESGGHRLARRRHWSVGEGGEGEGRERERRARKFITVLGVCAEGRGCIILMRLEEVAEGEERRREKNVRQLQEITERGNEAEGGKYSLERTEM